MNDPQGEDIREIPVLKAGSSGSGANAIRFRELFINPILQNAASVKVRDTLLLDLFSDRKYKACIERITVDVAGTVTIRTRLAGFDYAFATLSTFRGKSLVTVSVPETNELFVSTYDPETQKHYLKQADPSKLESLEGAAPLINENPSQNRPAGWQDSGTGKDIRLKGGQVLNGENEPDTIRLLVVYTPAAAMWAAFNEGSINNTIGSLMANAQLVLDNSNTLLTVSLVHSEQVDYTELNHSGDLYNLANPADGNMDNVHVLRDQYGADLVVLLEKTNYTGGQGWLLPTMAGDPDHGFSLTRVQQASWTYTTIHEIGHNLGCHHSTIQTTQPGPGLFPYSSGSMWPGNNGIAYCSIMTYESGAYFPDNINRIRVPYLSNPGLQFQGVTIGSETLSDNARTIRQTKSVIASYRSSCHLDVKVMLEGAINLTGTMNTGINNWLPLKQPYQDGSAWSYSGAESVSKIPSGVVDWILVELRQASDPATATPETVIYKRAAFLRSNGSIVDLDGVNLPEISLPNAPGNLYVVIRHRNHLSVMSAYGAELAGAIYRYDFTTGLAQAYGGGSGYKLMNSKAVMVSGDTDQDGSIYITDQNIWSTGFGTTGYSKADLNMDGDVFISDYNLWASNFGTVSDDRIKSGKVKPKYSSHVSR